VCQTKTINRKRRNGTEWRQAEETEEVKRGRGMDGKEKVVKNTQAPYVTDNLAA